MKITLPTPQKLIAFTTTTLLGTGLSLGDVTTWTGAGSTGSGNWTDAANWDNGAPGIDDTAIFSTTGMANQPDVGTSVLSIQQIQFDSAGWTISSGTGGGFIFRSGIEGIYNNVPGVNTVSVDTMSVNSSSDTWNWQVVAGSTLVINGGDYNRNNGNVISGDGLIIVNAEDVGGNPSDTSGFTGTLLTGENGTFNIGNGTTSATSTFGGIGALEFRKFNNGFIGGTIAPGGDGVLIPQIGALTFVSESTGRSGATFLSGSTLAMDIGTGGPGDNDKIETDFNGNPSLDIETGVTLALFGTIALDGTYVLIEDIDDSGDFSGTFETITWNGEDVTGDTDRFLLNYGNDQISITLTNVPEPSTYVVIIGLLAVCVTTACRRRQR
ncbi:hypothetical protein [Cerasicoccus frondis]|uniref:hypothetical protein n=1 Tax=Cerasicoccus frondis TaxID=490090 RepID=UPI002852613B|nr:hypothetical protein [Cerasicoccus frondis]